MSSPQAATSTHGNASTHPPAGDATASSAAAAVSTLEAEAALASASLEAAATEGAAAATEPLSSDGAERSVLATGSEVVGVSSAAPGDAIGETSMEIGEDGLASEGRDGEQQQGEERGEGVFDATAGSRDDGARNIGGARGSHGDGVNVVEKSGNGMDG
eukprot:1205013-Pleurochrysis_carterae.AAC.1